MNEFKLTPSVFPDPVWAIPTKSRPERAMGQPYRTCTVHVHVYYNTCTCTIDDRNTDWPVLV